MDARLNRLFEQCQKINAQFLGKMIRIPLIQRMRSIQIKEKVNLVC